MILGDAEIRRALASGEIVVDPMAPWALGSNSVDLHLAPTLRVYADFILRTDRDCPTREVRVDPSAGFLLSTGELYLASTVERTSSGPYLPVIDGTSGAGRLGISVHQTAGLGKGIRFSRLYAAALRHLVAWWRGEDLDPETGLSHLAHAACCVLFLPALSGRRGGDPWPLDDRPPGERPS